MHAVFRQSVCCIWPFACDNIFFLAKKSSKSPVSVCGRRSEQTDELETNLRSPRYCGMPPKTFKDQNMSETFFTVTISCYYTRIYLRDGVVDLVPRLWAWLSGVRLTAGSTEFPSSPKRPQRLWCPPVQCLLPVLSDRSPGFDHSPASPVGQDSVVGIATRYGLNDPGIESRWGRDFPHPSRAAPGPIQPPIQWVPRLFRG